MISLTPRQWQIVRLLVIGKTNQEIAKALGLSPSTISAHLRRIKKHLGCECHHQVKDKIMALVVGGDEYAFIGN